jgi:hypothetical protein
MTAKRVSEDPPPQHLNSIFTSIISLSWLFSPFGVTDYVYFFDSLDALNIGKKGET